MDPNLDTDAWDRIADLYDRAKGLPPEKREAFLKRETAANPRLADEVRDMLASELDTPWHELEKELGERDPGPEANAPTFRGAELGPYRLLELIGRGGMGDVYLAERTDGRLAQRLAVKVLRKGLATRSSVDRFERERRIQAALSHPSVLALIDTGATPDGHPFLVLPYVDGVPITRFADERRLSIPDRLRPFIEVCRAVQYAHSRLVVHRDIKPSNILVLEDGSVRLLDFGIAKLISEEALEGMQEETRESVAPMTPERAAPEQLRGEPVSTATDVWGLGVLLFEMLTGHLPFAVAGQSPSQIEKRITSDGAPELWTAVKGGEGVEALTHARSMTAAQIEKWLRGDLARVVAKALQVDPRVRYASASDLAKDVENVLAQKPVSARPDTAWYRIRRAAARRPALASAFVVGLMALLSIASVAILSARRVAAERDRATQEEARARTVVKLLVDLFGATAPAPGNDPRTVSIDALLTGGEARVAALSEQPEAQGEMYSTLARIRMERSEFAQSRSLFERSLERYRASGVAPSTPGRLSAVFGYAALLQRADAPKEAVQLLTDLLPSLEGSARSKDRARALQMLGESLGGPQGEAVERRALALFREIGATPLEIAEAHNSLAVLQFRAQRMAEAHGAWQEVLPVLERDLGPDHPDTLRILNNLSASSPDPESTVATLRRLIQSHERLLGPSSAPLSNDWNNLGTSLAGMRDYAGAETALRKSLAMRREILGQTHKETLNTWRNVARVIELRGRFEDALGEFVALDRIFERAGRPEDRAAVAVQRAQVLARLGRLGEAETIARNSLLIARKGGGGEKLNETNALLLLGKLALSGGDLPGAVARLEEALKLREGLLGPANPRLFEARAELGRARMAGGDSKGRALISDALPRLATWGIYHPDDLKTLQSLSDAGAR